LARAFLASIRSQTSSRGMSNRSKIMPQSSHGCSRVHLG
jgi:hypothetical protein